MNKPYFCPCPKSLGNPLGVGIGEDHLAEVGALYNA